MRLKIALLCAALVGLGNVRAGVVGISPTTFTPVAAASTQGFTFSTTGLGGIKLSGIGLWSASISAASNNPLTLTLSQSSGTGTESFARTFTVAASTANTGLELAFDSSITLEASKTYTATITYGATGLTNASFYKIAGSPNTYSVDSTATNYLSSPVAAAEDNVALKLFYDSTSIPEPATIILTGSALAAGAIGAYFKRRRKPQTEIAA